MVLTAFRLWWTGTTLSGRGWFSMRVLTAFRLWWTGTICRMWRKGKLHRLNSLSALMDWNKNLWNFKMTSRKYVLTAFRLWWTGTNLKLWSLNSLSALMDWNGINEAIRMATKVLTAFRLWWTGTDAGEPASYGAESLNSLSALMDWNKIKKPV